MWFWKRSRRKRAEPDRPAARREPAMPPGLRIYAVGDVHGRADLLRRMHALIDGHRAAAPCDRALEVYLGDLIDRGPRSREVIDLLIARRRTHELVGLLGNHERMLLDALATPNLLPFWIDNGGVETLLSYGLDMSRRGRMGRDENELGREIAAALPDAHHAFLSELPSHLVQGDYLFVHAGIRPGVPLAEQSLEDMLWIRDDFLRSSEELGAFVVHGHTPVARPEARNNRINIDTGAYMTGRLTCLILEDTRRAFLQT